MSRSRRKTPITGWTVAESDKPYKQYAHRRYRRAVKAALREGREPEPTDRLYFDTWHTQKDGKQWFGNMFGDRRHVRYGYRYNHRLGILTFVSISRHDIAVEMMRK